MGIAEEHAVTFAAGLAAGGMRPVVSLYSTFLQRAYDQMIHDVCLGSLPVIFTVDRSGIVGNDGETHQGIFDLSFLSTMPGMTVISPMDGAELTEVLDFALGQMVVRWQSATQEEKRTAVRKKKESRLCTPKQNFCMKEKMYLFWQ